MSVFDPLQDFGKWLLDVGFRFALKATARLPLAIAKSAKLMRLITLTGMSLLSLALLLLTLYVVKVTNAVRETEDIAKGIEHNIISQLSGAVKIAETTEWLIRSGNMSGESNSSAVIVQTLPWIKTAEVSGVVLITNNSHQVFYGKLDASSNSPYWDNIRWNDLRNKTAIELEGAGEAVTLFLGIERLYRTRQEFNQGRQLTGSLVLVRAWKEDNENWKGVVILLPVQSFNHILRLSADQYESGNYDYLVDVNGFLLAHPSPPLVYGTDPSGRDLRGAANYEEVGKFPVNTRDSDWIAGSDVLNKAFGDMLNRHPNTVVYKNLRNQSRLTSFRLVNFEGMKGKAIGIVAGRGLNYIEGYTVSLLLRSPAPFTTVLWAVAAVYIALLSGWLTFIAKFRSLHIDILAWSRFMNADTANGLGLLPIHKGELKDYHFTNMVAVVLSFGLRNQSRRDRDYVFEQCARLAAKMQEDGWITHIWSFRSVIACRPLAERVGEGKPYFWSPTNVVDYLNSLEEFQILQTANEGGGAYRAVYGIGDLHIKAGRIGTVQRATISVFGDCILDTIHSDEELDLISPAPYRALMYPIEEAQGAGLQIVGDKIMVNSRAYGKLQLSRLPK